MKNSPKIYNYARVSSVKQLKGGGLETQQQRSVLERLSREHNLPIHTENYVDEGLSAYHGKHKEGALGVVLEKIDDGTISSGSILVVFSLDRLSRETVNIAMEQLLSIINKGVRVYTHIDDTLFDVHSRNITADLILSLLTMQRANEESRTKSIRIKAAAKQALKKWKETGEPQGALGRVPLWIDQPTNSLNKNADGVKAAVELFLQGESTLKVKQYLDNNYPYSRMRKTQIKSAKTWDFSVLNQLWEKHSLYGEKRLSIDGLEYKLPNYYPALIDKATFKALQAIRKKKKGRVSSKGNIHFLKGLLRCGECGASMVFVDKGGRRKSYVCSLSLKGEQQHARELFNAEMLELVVLSLCKDQYALKQTELTSNDGQKENLELEIEQEQQELDDLLKSYRNKARSSILTLIEEKEDRLEYLKEKLEDEDSGIPDEFFELLRNEIYTDEIRLDFTHPKRKEFANIVSSIVSEVKLFRTTEDSLFSKTGKVNCVGVRILSKDGLMRELKVKPFSYVKANDQELLRISFEYIYDVPVKEISRNPDLIPDLVNELHSLELLNKLYPSKGKHQWAKKLLEPIEVDSQVLDFMPLPSKIDRKSVLEFLRDPYKSGIKRREICFNSKSKMPV